ncbi:hypothetical protein [Streptomyces sp. CBMA29]|uniref:hypothetical protein n=1 Tax=Streptomyces sp. CBMA29 TaxID=1896314 RepID=UPI001661926F|nr:hypothetical protein [Streptomyces sp. CBMA29]
MSDADPLSTFFRAHRWGCVVYCVDVATDGDFWWAVAWGVGVSLVSPLLFIALDALLLELRCGREVRRFRRNPGYILPPDDPSGLLAQQ